MAQELFDLSLQSVAYALGQDLARGQRVKALARIVDPGFHVSTCRNANIPRNRRITLLDVGGNVYRRDGDRRVSNVYPYTNDCGHSVIDPRVMLGVPKSHGRDRSPPLVKLSTRWLAPYPGTVEKVGVIAIPSPVQSENCPAQFIGPLARNWRTILFLTFLKRPVEPGSSYRCGDQKGGRDR